MMCVLDIVVLYLLWLETRYLYVTQTDLMLATLSSLPAKFWENPSTRQCLP